MARYNGTLESLFVFGTPAPRKPKKRRKRAVRDTQKQRLYAAENSVFGNTTGDSAPPLDFEDIAQIERYVDGLRITVWMREKYPAATRSKVRVLAGRGCNANALGMTLATWGYRKWTVLHELAHTVTDRVHANDIDIAGHGREYARVYLALVRRFIGVDEYKKLRAAFKAHKVKYSARKRRAQVSHLPRGNVAALAAYRETRKRAKVQAERLANLIAKEVPQALLDAGLPKDPATRLRIAHAVVDQIKARINYNG
jgi:putative metallohydrolase (TIGR04338 family)